MILWPTQIRRACLCPRLMVEEYKNLRKHWIRIAGIVLPVTFFHDHVAFSIFEAIAKGKDLDIIRLVDERRQAPEDLAAALWRHFDQKYFTPPLQTAIKSKKFTADIVMILAQGWGPFQTFLRRSFARNQASVCRQQTF